MNTIIGALLRRASTGIRTERPSSLTFATAGAAGLLGAAYMVAGEPPLSGPLGVAAVVVLVVLLPVTAFWPLRGERPQASEPVNLRVVAGRNHEAPEPALTCENEVSDAPDRRSAQLGAGS